MSILGNTDTLDIILGHLGAESLAQFSKASKECNERVNQSALWKWKLQASKQYPGGKIAASCMTHVAAADGDITRLIWLKALGHKWNEHTCAGAARNGQLECLKYLHDNGCPWNITTTQFAANGGHLSVLKYAIQNHAPGDVSLEDVCACLKRGNDLTVIKYMIELGYQFNSYHMRIALHAFK